MRKKTKQKTPTQLKRKYKTISNVCFGGEFLSVFAPFIAIGAVNYEKYFIQYDGVKISIGFVIAMAVMGVATYLTSKKNFTNSFVTLLVGWGVFVGITFLIRELLNDLCYISLFGWFGIAGAYGLDIGKKTATKQADKIQKGIDAAQQELIKDAYLEEKTQKKEKKEQKVRF